MKGLDFVIFHKNLFPRKKKWKNKKTFVDRNGDSTGEEIGFPNFILKKTRISVQVQLHLNSLRTRVVSLEPWILQTMVWVIITWETSTMVPLSSVSQDSIFHRHVRLDIWRSRSTRIHVRFHVPHRKTTNQSSDDHRGDTLSVDHRWETHGSLLATHRYPLLSDFPTSMLRCSMFRKVFDAISQKIGT
jgi:hypothetical protein